MLSAWSRLGVAWNVPPADQTPDLERLIIDSLHWIPANARMIVLITSWLSVYWRCVGRDRLLALAQAEDVRQQATLGLMLEQVDAWLPVAVFVGVSGKLRQMEASRPLLQVDQDRPGLRRLVQAEASPLSRRWGLWCLPIERKSDAIRPAGWVWSVNPSLRIRSFFKGSLKTSLLAALHAAGEDKPTMARLARECGVTRKAVYDAMEDLRFSNLLSPPQACDSSAVGYAGSAR